MPPKVKVTREDILSKAVDLVREKGEAGLNARALANRLNCSTQPVFRNFPTMQELRQEVIREAERRYEAFTRKAMEETKYPPYKASGMAYIRFAKEERELFKLLFMRDRSREGEGPGLEMLEDLLRLISHQTGLSREEAYLFHLEMWVYVHGAASMVATAYLNWEEDALDNMLTDVFQGLKERWETKKRTAD